MTEVPPEFRIYIKPEDVNKLPKGIRIYRGPKGGLYVDRRQLESMRYNLRDLGVSEVGEEGEGQPQQGEYQEPEWAAELKDKIRDIVNKIDMRDLKYLPSADEYYIYDPDGTERKEFLVTLAGLSDYSNFDEFVMEVSSIYEELGFDKELAEKLAKGTWLFRLWTGEEYKRFAGCVEEVIHALKGNDRLKRDCLDTRYKEYFDRITAEDVYAYKKFSEAMFERFYGNSATVYRGISRIETQYLLVSLYEDLEEYGYFDLDNVEIVGTLASTSIDYDTAEGFARNHAGVVVEMIVTPEEVWGGWWNAAVEHIHEAEIISEITKGKKVSIIEDRYKIIKMLEFIKADDYSEFTYDDITVATSTLLEFTQMSYGDHELDFSKHRDMRVRLAHVVNEFSNSLYEFFDDLLLGGEVEKYEKTLASIAGHLGSVRPLTDIENLDYFTMFTVATLARTVYDSWKLAMDYGVEIDADAEERITKALKHVWNMFSTIYDKVESGSEKFKDDGAYRVLKEYIEWGKNKWGG